MKTIFLLGNVLSMSVERYRSSPRRRRFSDEGTKRNEETRSANARRERHEKTKTRQARRLTLVEGIDDVLGVVLDDIGVGEERNPVTRLSLGSLDSVHRETSRETGDSSKDGLEGLGLMMGDVVLED